jgi:D-3-phosphoglycerate dehydrogenase
LTKNTYHLLGEPAFNAMKKGVYLINNARGGIVDEAALLDALEAGIVAYASLDVFEQEPPSQHNPLLNHPRVFVTPHIAWNTQESTQKLTDQCIENLKKYFLSAHKKSAITV